MRGLAVILCFVFFHLESGAQELKLDVPSGLHYIMKKGQSSGNIIVMLHGYGSNEGDLFSFSNYFPNATFICLQAPIKRSNKSYSWFDITFKGEVKSVDTVQANNSAAKLNLFLKNIQRSGNQKVLIGGFSQGAIMSLKTGIENPQLVNGLLCFSGSTLGDNFKPDNSLSAQYKKLKAFYAHGTQDKVLPIEKGRASNQMLQKAGIQTLYKEYPMKHQINSQVIQDALKWYRTVFAK